MTIHDTGGGMMPIAAPGRLGASWQEAVITALLVSLSLAIVAACGLVLWGLRLGARNA